MKPQTYADANKAGSPAEASSSPIMNLCIAPKDNILTFHRLNFEILRLLTDKDNNIAYTHPLSTNKKLNYAHVPEGNSRCAKIKKSKVIMKVL